MRETVWHEIAVTLSGFALEQFRAKYPSPSIYVSPMIGYTIGSATRLPEDADAILD